MNTKVERLEDGTITLTITIPWQTIAQTYDHVVDEIVEQSEVSGFRKGKAPRTMVEPKLDKNKTYEEVIKHLVPNLYQEAIEKEKILPIISPEVNLKEAKEGSDWIIVAKTAQKPEIQLGDYKKAIKEAKNAHANKIVLPGQKEEDQEVKKPTMDQLLLAILPTITARIPSILLEHEVTNQLSNLVDQTRKIGVTIEQYLASTQRTTESIRAEYSEQAKRSLTLEFGLEAIADAEKIVASDADIENVIKSAKNDEERSSMESQKYYVASIVRRQKTLDFLAAV